MSSGKLLTYCFKQFVFNRLLPGMGNPSWQTRHGWGQWQGIHTGSFAPYALPPSNVSREHQNSELKAHGDGRGHQAKEGNAASEIAREIRTKQGNIEGALRNSEAAAVQQRRVKDETLKAEASLPTLMATHNLPLGTIIFDGFLPFLTLFTTF